MPSELDFNESHIDRIYAVCKVVELQQKVENEFA
jgi:hypothetical protein